MRIPRRWRKRATSSTAPTSAELNIIPFLDIVTNLLLFLLATVASVLATVDVEASLPSSRPCPRGACTEPDVDTLGLSVTLTSRGIVVASRNGIVAPGCEGVGPGVTIPSVSGADARPDFTALSDCISRVHSRYPTESRVILSADPDVPYEDLIGAMDAVREDGDGPLFSDVLISAGVR